jgi:hypothetical protein
MKFKITLIGLLTIIAGVLPILDLYNVFKSPIPVDGLGYALIILVIGIIDLLYSFLANIELLGFQHVVTGLIAIMTILGGVLPLLHKSLPPYIPTSGVLYYSVIVGIGVFGFIYGLTQLRYG